jgi:hypothetical protein
MAVAKSANTWFQLPLKTKLEYKSKLIQLHGFKCNRMNGNGCGNYFPSDMLTVDHVIPISMGGPVCELSNMQLLCFKCHRRKTWTIDRKGLTFNFLALGHRSHSSYNRTGTMSRSWFGPMQL